MALFKHGKKQQPKSEPNQQSNNQQQPSQAANNFPPNNQPAGNQYFQDVPDYPVNNSTANTQPLRSMPERNSAAQPAAPTGSPAPQQAPRTDSPANNPANQPLQQRPLSTQSPAAVSHPHGSLENWEYTEKQLKELESHQKELKSQLKVQLLSSRTFYSHLIQSKQSVHLDRGAIELEVQKIQRINDTLRYWFGTDMISGDVFFSHDRKYFIVQPGLLDPENQKREQIADLAYYLDDHNVLPSVITLDYDENLYGRWQSYLDDGIVNPESNLVNIYDYFQTEGLQGTKPIQGPNTGIEISPQAHVENDDENNIDRVYLGNDLVMQITKDIEGRPANIDHYHDNEVISSDYLDEQGINRLTKVFNPRNPEEIMDEFYYRLDNSLAIVKSKMNGEPYIQVMNRSNILVKSFDTEQDFIVWWLAEKILDDNSTIIVPLSSPIHQALLEQSNGHFKVLPFVDNYANEQTQLANILDNTQLLSDGILVNSEDAQQEVSQASQGKVNVSLITNSNKSDNAAPIESTNTAN